MDKISVLIADDHPPFRAGLRALLESEPDIEVVGEAETGALTILLAAKHQPDVILMDLQMPDVAGIEATRRILNLIAHHHANPEIAERLDLSLKTVRNHVSNIFSKLQVVDRAQAILRAKEAGLGREASSD